MATNPETTLSNAIIAALKKKYPNAWVHKNVVAKAKLGSGFFSSVGLGVGSPDIVCCVNGYFIGLEVKCPGKDLADHQVDWFREFRKSGGVVECVRCIRDAVKVIDAVLDGSYKPSYLG